MRIGRCCCRKEATVQKEERGHGARLREGGGLCILAFGETSDLFYDGVVVGKRKNYLYLEEEDLEKVLENVLSCIFIASVNLTSI